MGVYATYDFYKTEYCGELIAEDAFAKWIERSSRQIDIYTSRRLLDAYPIDEYDDRQIKMCACVLADRMYEVDKYMKSSEIQKDGTSKMVKSKTAGSESVTFATGETVYASVIKDQRSLRGFYYSIAAEYLADVSDINGTMILYRGM